MTVPLSVMCAVEYCDEKGYPMSLLGPCLALHYWLTPALLYRGSGDPTTNFAQPCVINFAVPLKNPLIDATTELDHRSASEHPLGPHEPNWEPLPSHEKLVSQNRGRNRAVLRGSSRQRRVFQLTTDRVCR